jgi:hypothetical protein
MTEIVKLSFSCVSKKKKKVYDLFKEIMQEFEKYLEVGSLFMLYKNFCFLNLFCLVKNKLRFSEPIFV